MSKGEETRERILEHGLALAGVLGLEGLSLGELAKSSGLSKSGLFAHFGSKEDLQLKILEAAKAQFVAEVVSPALRAPRGVPRLRALFERWLAWEKSRQGGCPFVEASYELDDRPGPVRDAIAATQRDWVDTLRHALDIAIEEGHLAARTDTRQLAFELYGIFLAYHLYQRLLDDEAAADRARAGFDRLLAESR